MSLSQGLELQLPELKPASIACGLLMIFFFFAGGTEWSLKVSSSLHKKYRLTLTINTQQSWNDLAASPLHSADALFTGRSATSPIPTLEDCY